MMIKITATRPATAMIAFRMLIIIDGKASLLLLQPAASLTSAAAFELHTSVARVGKVLKALKPMRLASAREISLADFSFINLL